MKVVLKNKPWIALLSIVVLIGCDSEADISENEPGGEYSLFDDVIWDNQELEIEETPNYESRHHFSGFGKRPGGPVNGFPSNDDHPISYADINAQTDCPIPRLNLSEPIITSQSELFIFVECHLDLVSVDESGVYEDMPWLIRPFRHSTSARNYVAQAILRMLKHIQLNAPKEKRGFLSRLFENRGKDTLRFQTRIPQRRLSLRELSSFEDRSPDPPYFEIENNYVILSKFFDAIRGWRFFRPFPRKWREYSGSTLSDEERLMFFRKVFLITKFRSMTADEENWARDNLHRFGLGGAIASYFYNWSVSPFYQEHFDYSQNPEPLRILSTMYGRVSEQGMLIENSRFRIENYDLYSFNRSGITQNKVFERNKFCRRLRPFFQSPPKDYNLEIQFYRSLEQDDITLSLSDDSHLPAIETFSIASCTNKISVELETIPDESGPEDSTWPEEASLDNPFLANLNFSIGDNQGFEDCRIPNLNTEGVYEPIGWQEFITCALPHQIRGTRIGDQVFEEDYFPLLIKQSAYSFVSVIADAYSSGEQALGMSYVDILANLYRVITFSDPTTATLNAFQQSIGERGIDKTIDDLLIAWYHSSTYTKFDYSKTAFFPHSKFVFQGIVNTESGLAVEKANIRYRKNPEDEWNTIQTDAVGMYAFEQPFASFGGIIEIEVSKEGYNTLRKSVIITEDTIRISQLDFVLTPLGHISAAYGGQIVSDADSAGQIKITVNPGVVNQNEEFQISKPAVQTLGDLNNIPSTVFTITPDYQFNSAVKVEVQLAEQFLNNFPNETDWAIMTDIETGFYESLVNLEYDADSATVSGEIDHFSRFFVVPWREMRCWKRQPSGRLVCVHKTQQNQHHPSATILDSRTASFPSSLPALKEIYRNILTLGNWPNPNIVSHFDAKWNESIPTGIVFSGANNCLTGICNSFTIDPEEVEYSEITHPDIKNVAITVSSIEGDAEIDFQAEQCAINPTISNPQLRLNRVIRTEIDVKTKFEVESKKRYFGCLKTKGSCPFCIPWWYTKDSKECWAKFTAKGDITINNINHSYNRGEEYSSKSWSGSQINPGRSSAPFTGKMTSNYWNFLSNDHLRDGLRDSMRQTEGKIENFIPDFVEGVRDAVIQNIEEAQLNDPEFDQTNCYKKPIITVENSPAKYLSARGGRQSTALQWKSDERGEFSLLLDAKHCSDGSQVSGDSGAGLVPENQTITTQIDANDIVRGEHNLSICVEGVFGETTYKEVSESIIRDDFRPNIVSSSELNGGVYTEDQSTYLSCSDNFECKRMGYTLDGTAPNYNMNGEILTSNPIADTISFRGDGFYQLEAIAQDKALNDALPLRLVFTIDRNPPSIQNLISDRSFVSVNGYDKVQFSWEIDKIANYEIINGVHCDSGSLLASGDALEGVIMEDIIKATDLNQGENNIHICATGLNGLTGSVSTKIYREDSPPTVTIMPPGGPYDSVQDIVINCVGSFLNSCSRVIYTTDGSDPVFTEVGDIINGSIWPGLISTPDRQETILRVRAFDNAGNQTKIHTVEYSIDSIVPEVSILNVENPNLSVSGGIEEGRITWQSNASGLAYTVRLNSVDCETGVVLGGLNGEGETGSGPIESIFVAGELEPGENTIRICTENLIGSQGSSLVSVTRSENPASITTEPLVRNTVSNNAGFESLDLQWTSDQSIDYVVMINASCSDVSNSNGDYASGQLSAGATITSIILSSDLRQGPNNILICAKNLFGLESLDITNIIRDDTSPSLTVAPLGGVFAGSSLTVSVDCLDNEASCHEIVYTLDGSEPTFGESPVFDGADIEIVSEGFHALRIKAIDSVGNVETSQVHNFTLSSDVPSVSASKISNPYVSVNGKTTTELTLQNFESEELSFKIVSGDNCESGLVLREGTSSEINVNQSILATELSPGENELTLCASVATKTEKFKTSFNVFRKDTAPTVHPTIGSGAYGQERIVHFVCAPFCEDIIYTDNGTDPAFSPDGSGEVMNGDKFDGDPWLTPDQANTILKYKAIDRAGNITEIGVDEYTIDSSLPTINVRNVDTTFVTSLDGGFQTATLLWETDRLDLDFKVVFGNTNCDNGLVPEGHQIGGAIESELNSSTIVVSEIIPDGSFPLRICSRNLIGQWGFTTIRFFREDVLPAVEKIFQEHIGLSSQGYYDSRFVIESSIPGSYEIRTGESCSSSVETAGPKRKGELFDNVPITAILNVSDYNEGENNVLVCFVGRNGIGADLTSAILRDETPPELLAFPTEDTINTGSTLTYSFDDKMDDQRFQVYGSLTTDGFNITSDATDFIVDTPANGWPAPGDREISIVAFNIAGISSELIQNNFYVSSQPEWIRLGNVIEDGYLFSGHIIGTTKAANNDTIGNVQVLLKNWVWEDVYFKNISGTRKYNWKYKVPTAADGYGNDRNLWYKVRSISAKTGETLTYLNDHVYNRINFRREKNMDINGDGYSDIVRGLPGKLNQYGSLSIFYGGSPMDKSTDVEIEGELTGQNFAFAFDHAGDVNSDGFGDIIIGAYHYGNPDDGRVYLLPGASSLPASMKANNNRIQIIDSRASDEQFGYRTVGVGDPNNDGYADVIITTGTTEYLEYSNNVEAVYFYKGSSSGLKFGKELNHGNWGTSYGSHVGVAAGGDFTGDGIDDVVIGSLKVDVNCAPPSCTINYFDYLHSGGSGLSKSPVARGAILGESISYDALSDPHKLRGQIGDVRGGNGIAEVLMGAIGGPNNSVRMYNGSSSIGDYIWANTSWSHNANRHSNTLVDVNKDGFSEVLFALNSSVKYYEGGANFDQTIDKSVNIGEYPPWYIRPGGDLNGDGFPDFYVYNLRNYSRIRIIGGGPNLNPAYVIEINGK